MSDDAGWETAVDEATGKQYRFNRATGEVEWIRRSRRQQRHAAARSREEGAAAAAAAAAASRGETKRQCRSDRGAWVEKLDTSSGRPYFVNSETRESVWVLPAGASVTGTGQSRETMLSEARQLMSRAAAAGARETKTSNVSLANEFWTGVDRGTTYADYADRYRAEHRRKLAEVRAAQAAAQEAEAAEMAAGARGPARAEPGDRSERAGWTFAVDPATGARYRFNPLTGESEWCEWCAHDESSRGESRGEGRTNKGAAAGGGGGTSGDDWAIFVDKFGIMGGVVGQKYHHNQATGEMRAMEAVSAASAASAASSSSLQRQQGARGRSDGSSSSSSSLEIFRRIAAEKRQRERRPIAAQRQVLLKGKEEEQQQQQQQQQQQDRDEAEALFLVGASRRRWGDEAFDGDIDDDDDDDGGGGGGGGGGHIDATDDAAGSKWVPYLDKTSQRPCLWNKETGETKYVSGEEEEEDEEDEQETTTAPAQGSDDDNPMRASSGKWQRHLDDASGRYYESNLETGETRWVQGDDEAKGSGGGDDEDEAGEWQRHLDEASGKYYESNSETGETRWIVAEDSDAAEAAGEWQRYLDDASGRYYESNHETGETRWIEGGEEGGDGGGGGGGEEEGNCADAEYEQGEGGWRAFLDDSSGRWYEVHKVTGKTRWIEAEDESSRP